MDMIYKNTRERTILMDSEYDGVRYVIISYGTHPCCYVKMPKAKKDFDFTEINCHGGITYSEKHLFLDDRKENGWWIGWDYAHDCDRYGEDIMDGISYSTDELSNECRYVIKQIKETL